MGEFDSQRFDKRRHDRSTFSCGEAALDRWLREQASQANARDSARVYVRCDDASSVVGFLALAMASVRPEDAPPLPATGGLPLPAVLIARLAVDRRWQGRGIARELLLDAIQVSIAASDLVAARIIVVDALDQSAEHFYRHHGFRDLRTTGPTQRLWLSMGRARASQ